MKNFSHPDRDEKQPADLNQAIQSTATVSRNEWKYVADMDLDLDPGLRPVPCLVGGINQVLLNLIVNAAQAIADAVGERAAVKGKIRISTSQYDGEVEIRVSDTGAGIPVEVRDKIFNPFFTTKPVGKGTGQGLALAHNIIVEKHQGSIQVETEVGKGTTFIVRLPADGDAVPGEGGSGEEAHSVC
jgi:signal transduction histidine kinase